MEEEKKPSKLLEIYDKRYRQLMIVPFALLIISLSLIGYKYFTTGYIFDRDVSLKGGVILTIPTHQEISHEQLRDYLAGKLPDNDIVVRGLRNLGNYEGFIIEADIDGNNREQTELLLSSIGRFIKADLNDMQYGMETIGSSLGESFFNESIKIVLVAFLFMGMVVFIYFRTFIPSVAIILAAFSDMAVALAVINLLGIKIGTAGIAGFLMLIGYSIDTDILLTVRVLKRKEGTLMDKILSSIKTGMTETITAIVAIGVAILITQSGVIKQIMLILLIGLAADIIFTWIQNVGLLRIYLERKEKKMTGQ